MFREPDWSLLVFFAGLFLATAAIESTGLAGRLFATVGPLARVAAVLSNLVSNVPAVPLYRPLAPYLPDRQRAWLTLATATTLAGNLTLSGSVANLIVAEIARARGVRPGFVEHLRAGTPIILATLAPGTLWLTLIR